MYVISGKELEQLLERVLESYSYGGGSNFLSCIGINKGLFRLCSGRKKV